MQTLTLQKTLNKLFEIIASSNVFTPNRLYIRKVFIPDDEVMDLNNLLKPIDEQKSIVVKERHYYLDVPLVGLPENPEKWTDEDFQKIKLKVGIEPYYDVDVFAEELLYDLTDSELVDMFIEMETNQIVDESLVYEVYGYRVVVDINEETEDFIYQFDRLSAAQIKNIYDECGLVEKSSLVYIGKKTDDKIVSWDF